MLGKKALTAVAAVGLGGASMLTALGLSGPAGAASNSPSAPGVTATTVTVGQVDDLTAPLPGLFKSAEDGTQAYFNYINSQGGVNGRKLMLDAKDSAFNSSQVATETQDMAKNDFALVGGFSLLDQAQVPIINQTQVPDVAYPRASSCPTTRTSTARARPPLTPGPRAPSSGSSPSTLRRSSTSASSTARTPRRRSPSKTT